MALGGLSLTPAAIFTSWRQTEIETAIEAETETETWFAGTETETWFTETETEAGWDRDLVRSSHHEDRVTPAISAS